MPNSQIGQVSFDPESGDLLTSAGRKTLRPQTTKVLSVLVENAGQMVSKERLMETVWPDTTVTDDSLVQCISEIRKALRDSDDVDLVTIPKKGYRLDLPPAFEAQGKDVEKIPTQSKRRTNVLVAAVVVVIGIVALAFWLSRPDAPQKQISIAVLPFLNMSGDVSQDYFSVVSDQFEPVSTRAGSLSPMPRRVDATQRERRRGSS